MWRLAELEKNNFFWTPTGDQIEQVYKHPIKIQFLDKAFLHSNSGSITPRVNLGRC